MQLLFALTALIIAVVNGYDLRELKSSLEGSRTVTVTAARATATVYQAGNPSVVVTVQQQVAPSVAVETAIVTETIRIKKKAPTS